MDIYKKRFYLNVVLAAFGAIILIITLIYSNFLASKLKEREAISAVIYSETLKELANQNESGALQEDIRFYQMITDSFSLPVIIRYEDGVLIGNNWGKKNNDDSLFLSNKVLDFERNNKSPLKGPYGAKIYPFNSPLHAYIKYYPMIQILLVTSFVILGIFFFNSSKRAEQNRVWAGMAKETAHQLGTPISAIMAWIEHLKELVDSEEEKEVINELNNDVKRLELIADRFSKIGSDPVLNSVNINQQLNQCKDYMQKRASRKVVFDFPEDDAVGYQVKINQHLFDWVIENLIRNALDAMGGEGTISAQISTEGNFIHIDLTDTGKGIPSADQKLVFEPGFTTKKRGWGLGLSLAKRIIEDYHKGKIFVKSSKLGEGTTFTIKLPK